MVQPLWRIYTAIHALSVPQAGQNQSEHTPTSVQLNSRGTQRDRQTHSHVIGPLNDIIAENLGQRGRRDEELAHQADTMAALSNMDARLISARGRWKHLVKQRRSAILYHFKCVRCIKCLESFIHNLLIYINMRPAHKHGSSLLICHTYSAHSSACIINELCLKELFIEQKQHKMFTRYKSNIQNDIEKRLILITCQYS